MFEVNTKILIVDDMRTIRLAIKHKLKQLGLENITEADDGASAWPLLLEAHGSGQPFQLVLSDWNMPSMHGNELLKKVREHPELKLTPFMLLATEQEQEHVKKAVKLGVNNYVTKPFTLDTLKERLETVHASLKK